MKKLTTLALVPVFALVFLISSCGKTSTTNGGSGDATLTYSGASHTFHSSAGLVAVTSANEIALSADESSTGKTLTVLITGSSSSGTYTYDATRSLQISSGSVIYSTTNPNGGYSSGSMTITEGVGTATASFTGTLYNLSNGSDNYTFSGSYTGGLYKH